VTCQTATLVYTQLGVDAGTTHTLTVQSRNGGCTVADVVQGYSPVTIRNGSTTETFTCSGLARSADGGLLAASCGTEGDLTLRPRPPEQVGHVCGEIFQNSAEVTGVGTDLSVSQIEACFWRAYQARMTTTLLYTADDEVIVTRTFTIQPSGGTCMISDSTRHAGVAPGSSTLTAVACAGVEQRDGGLLVNGCGADGTSFVPPGRMPSPSA